METNTEEEIKIDFLRFFLVDYRSILFLRNQNEETFAKVWSPMESAFLTCTVSSSFFSALKPSTVSINGSVLLDSTSLRAHLNLFGRSLWSLRSFTDTEFYFPTWCAQISIDRLNWLNPCLNGSRNYRPVHSLFFFALDHRIRLSSPFLQQEKIESLDLSAALHRRGKKYFYRALTPPVKEFSLRIIICTRVSSFFDRSCSINEKKVL